MPDIQTTTTVEIRARHDRNRLLGTFDPVRKVLRLFHRGEVVVIDLSNLDSSEPAIVGHLDVKQ